MVPASRLLHVLLTATMSGSLSDAKLGVKIMIKRAIKLNECMNFFTVPKEPSGCCDCHRVVLPLVLVLLSDLMCEEAKLVIAGRPMCIFVAGQRVKVSSCFIYLLLLLGNTASASK